MGMGYELITGGIGAVGLLGAFLLVMSALLDKMGAPSGGTSAGGFSLLAIFVVCVVGGLAVTMKMKAS